MAEAESENETAGTDGGAAGKKAGTVALIGRPNSGKSTLMNHLLREKVAIVSDKPQTTRHRLIGVLNDPRGQMVFHDTPGIHKPLHRMNRQMVNLAVDALNGADVVCLLVDASTGHGSGENHLIEMVLRSNSPKVVVLNKVDMVNKGKLLPRMEIYGQPDVGKDAGGDLEEPRTFDEIVPISAATGDGTDILLDILFRLLPEGEPLYAPDTLTLHPDRFLVSELIREKVLANTRDELPFTTAVMIDGWEEPGPGLVRIYASILVERSGQKKILIGRQGSMVKLIGTAARKDLENLLGRRVYLDLQVKHEPNWRENRRILSELDRNVWGRMDV